MKSPAFQFYPKDYESDENVKLMSLAQEGVYLRLLCHQWLEGSVPDDLASLAKLCRVPRGQMARLWSGVKACFPPVEERAGRLANLRMERDRERLESYKQERSESGKRGAKVRHGSATSLASGSAIEQPLAKASTPSPSASATPNNGENERSFVNSENPPNGNGTITESEYADVVWSKFLERSGQPATRIMSPVEFSTLKGWLDAGIPLRIVLRGIADTKGKGGTLAYYGPSVKAAYDYWRQAMA